MKSVLPEKWLLWTDVERDPPHNMAIDEALLSTSSKLGEAVLLRTYGWDTPSISIGYNQKYPSDTEKKYTVVRRITGGGLVFHDCDITYTFIVPPSHRIYDLGRMESYRIFHHPVVKFFKEYGMESCLSANSSMPDDRSRMECFRNPAKFDVVSKGKKLAGAAQRRSRNGILHQGSVSVENMNHSRKRLLRNFIAAYSEWFHISFEPFQLSNELFEEAEKICSLKYSSDSWNSSGKIYPEKVMKKVKNRY